MAEPDLSFVLQRLDAMQKELRDGLHTMRLRDEQCYASYQTMIQTLTRQMVEVASTIDLRLAGIDQRLDRIEGLLRRLPP